MGAAGVRAVDEGVLHRPVDGHAAGTPYVVVQADSLFDCDVAQRRLRDISSVPSLVWAHGWRLGESHHRRVAFELTLFAPERPA